MPAPIYEKTDNLRIGDKVHLFGHPDDVRLVIDVLHIQRGDRTWIMAYREDKPSSPEYLLDPIERGEKWQKVHA